MKKHVIEILGKALLLIALVLAPGACIHNDLPYPRIPQEILSLAVEGQVANASINNNTYQVKVFLPETQNPAEVKFSEYTYTEGAESSLNLLEGTYDLTTPLKVTLSRYQSYEWLIVAEQNIERYLTVAGQIGETTFDVPGRRIILTVPESLNLKKLDLTSFKLGPAGITEYSPDLQLGPNDFSRPVDVNVTYFGKTETWTIYVETVAQLVSTSQVDAWSQVIWAYGEGPDEGDFGFQYRQADSDQWLDVPKEWLSGTSSQFSARIIHLQPLTQYVVRAVVGEHIGNEVTVTTDPTEILPDGNFEQWWLKKNKIWCPWDENGEQYWDTGNTGSAVAGPSNVTPTDYTPVGQGKAAKLETINVLVKLAAGSIFTGSFKKIDGTNGILDFGRPWTLRPTRLRGYYQYKSATVNKTTSGFEWMAGKPDSCHIYVLLTDWTTPFEIRTNPNNRHLLDFDADYVIAYGGVKTSESSDSYKEFDVPLQYRSTSRKPSMILVCAASSIYGDYFTGGVGSTLYVDQFSLEYDY